MKELEIFRTNHWVVSHRSDARYLGYLIASSKEKIDDFSKLSSEALRNLKIALNKAEQLIISTYSPSRIIIAKLGQHEKVVHFHILPISNIIAQQISNHTHYSKMEPEEKKAILFVSHEYCEIPLNEQQKADILKEVTLLKERYKSF